MFVKHITVVLCLALLLLAAPIFAQSTITWSVANGSTVDITNHNSFSTIAAAYPSSGAHITWMTNSNDPPAHCSVYYAFPSGQGLAVMQCDGSAIPGYYSFTLRATDSAGATGGTLTVTLHVLSS